VLIVLVVQQHALVVEVVQMRIRVPILKIVSGQKRVPILKIVSRHIHVLDLETVIQP
jgi:hypothetical protein